jgi:hypothetical protein
MMSTMPCPPVTAGTKPAVYLVATDGGDDPEYTAAVAAGLWLAREAGAPVVLYDRSTEPRWVASYEIVTGTASGPGACQPLEPARLRDHGHPGLAHQLEQAQGMGLDAHAVTASGTGPAAMAAACRRFGVTHVVLPAKLARPSLRDRLLRRTLADFQARLTGVQLIAVDRWCRARPVQAPSRVESSSYALAA